MNNFITWYKTSSNNFRVYNHQTKQFATVDKLVYESNQFEMFKGYEPTDESLSRFADDMLLWRDEILNSGILKKRFDYFSAYKYNNSRVKYANHANSVHLFMKYHLQVPDSMDTITLEEADWYAKTNCAGLIYNQPGTYDEVTTYDRRLFYPSTLGIKTDNEAYKFMFPTKAGKVGKISKVPAAGFAYGIYHVKVESKGDKRFEKMFAFSKNDHYTHTSLNFVMNVYNKHHGGNIQLTLMSNKCLRYDKKDLVESSSVFRNWYSILQKIKLKFPKNKLVKHLSSSAWGHLVSTNTIIKSFDDVDPDDYSTDLDSPARYYLREVVGQSSGFMFLKLVDKSKPLFQAPIPYQTVPALALSSYDGQHYDKERR
ncbi:hypothetical protein DYB25_005530 [Aphanomyces astaci]|uniref:Uncharacterized protein n=1 Tax=Aphanomyces astaci TaxID=112090 RepID=A0A397E546_APHAT|nr:hypothetical protein DYB25_005530 [Aphanomyces astaci]RHY18196.1 hypothetical protein DYB36_003330 [Aphanomyces astaci]RHY42667.1 hypothetical protein DYB38_010579 [Aphanomyces astaci]RHY74025.1 hypothetical protein DYB30_009050 [Aphanomyces astaci]RHY76711.1 hypothetical protein DYB34_008778 [Aphanomyces astaci]